MNSRIDPDKALETFIQEGVEPDRPSLIDRAYGIPDEPEPLILVDDEYDPDKPQSLGEVVTDTVNLVKAIPYSAVRTLYRIHGFDYDFRNMILCAGLEVEDSFDDLISGLMRDDPEYESL